MKIRRKPKVGGHWSDTDAREPIDLVDEWKPGTTFVLDGTIDKDGTRHSLIGLDISEDDVQALLIKLIENYKITIADLQKKYEALAIENDQRKAAFQLLEEVIEPHIHPDLFDHKPHDLPTLFENLYDIVQFGISESLKDLTLPDIPWINREEEE